jgi:ligand-binding sensor domain-containing protein
VNWTVYNTSNSELPSNWVYSIAIDGQGNKWIGTYDGLAVYREGGVILPVVGKRKSKLSSNKIHTSPKLPEPVQLNSYNTFLASPSHKCRT